MTSFERLDKHTLRLMNIEKKFSYSLQSGGRFPEWEIEYVDGTGNKQIQHIIKFVPYY